MGIAVRDQHVHPVLMLGIALGMERMYQLAGKPEPKVTRLQVRTCVQDAWYAIDRARRDLGYAPLVTTHEGLRRCVPDALALYESLPSRKKGPRLRVEIERVLAHPIDDVFRCYTDHVGWSRWAKMGAVSLAREGSPDVNGVGAVRAFRAAPGLEEEVVTFEPPHRMEYRVVKGGFPITDHHGEVLFAKDGSGTRVTWRVSFRSKVPGVGKVLESGIGKVFERILDGLTKELDKRPRV
jgi:uncharacterized protein YndB with AHSA1/START domain